MYTVRFDFSKYINSTLFSVTLFLRKHMNFFSYTSFLTEVEVSRSCCGRWLMWEFLECVRGKMNLDNGKNRLNSLFTQASSNQ